VGCQEAGPSHVEDVSSLCFGSRTSPLRKYEGPLVFNKIDIIVNHSNYNGKEIKEC